MNRSLYAMFDSAPSGCTEVTLEEAGALNQKGYGIYWTVNEFNGPRRAENLVRVNSWAIELDGGDKLDQWRRIKKGIVPSLIIETKNGFHVYFHAKDGKAETYKAIVADRLVPFFGADPRAKDVARILRVPGFLHWKDILNPYPVKTVHEADVSYTEEEMLMAFPLPKAELQRRKAYKAEMAASGNSDFWVRVYEMDQMEALERLSGSKWVRFEHYTFRPVTRGRHNILVNGKGTSCFIDEFGKIGSLTGGGPAVGSWLKWMGHDYKTIYRILTDVFPELEKGGDRDARRSG